MVEVIGTDEFAEWFLGLESHHAEAVDRVVSLLEARGVGLGFPYSSEIKGSKLAFRELRIKSSGSQLRMIYAFDPRRNAVLILGGDKTDGRFYDRIIPAAEKVWLQYLEEQEAK